MTAAHNAVRARQMNPVPEPALPPMTWSAELADIAQNYAEELAADDCGFRHSMRRGVGENLAAFGGQMATATMVTEAWAGEEECYTFGRFMMGDACDMQCTSMQMSNGCGHYTQIVWRDSTELGCGVADCSGAFHQEVWVCNYRQQGNVVGFPMY